MKKTKLSTRAGHGREMNRPELEQTREQMQMLEQERIDFDHRSNIVRNNLYGVAPASMGRGWVDSSRR